MGEKFDGGLDEGLWLWVPHKVLVKMLAGATVI